MYAIFNKTKHTFELNSRNTHVFRTIQECEDYIEAQERGRYTVVGIIPAIPLRMLLDTQIDLVDGLIAGVNKIYD